jgi:hypothetical protein
MPEKVLLTIADFVAEFSVSRRTVYREIGDGHLVLTKVRRRSYITRHDAQAWLARARVDRPIRAGR